MLIRQIKLIDIYTFAGEQSIVLPTKDETNLTVILARNSAGKTSLLRALKFLFYGIDPKDAELLVNREALRRAKVGDFVKAVAIAKCAVGKREFTLQRTVRVQKVKNSPRPQFFDTNVLLVSHDADRDFKVQDPELIRGRIDEMLPASLFDFFFFKGEELTARLLSNRDSGIAAALSDVLYRSKWKSALESLAAVEKQFAAEARTVKGQTEQYQQLLQRKDGIIRRQDEIKLKLHDVDQKIGELRAEYKRLDAEYISASSANRSQIKEKYLGLRSQAEQVDNLIKTRSLQLLKEVGDSAGIIFLGKAFGPAQQLLTSMHKKGLLPPEVTLTLVKKLLAENECICGACLDEGTDARKRIERYRKDSLDARLSHELFNLLTKVDNAFPSKRKQRIASIVEIQKQLEQDHETLSNLLRDVASLERQYDEQAERDAESRVKSIKSRRDAVHEELEDEISKRADIQPELRELENEFAGLSRELSKIQHVPDAAKALLAGEQLAHKLREHAEFYRAQMEGSFQKSLQTHTRELYSKVVVDGSEACIDPNTLLPSIRWNGVSGYQAGGGQQQTLVLAYIAALSQLRKNINAEMRRYFSLGEVAEQCFFMDSVFGPMEPAYREKVCAAVPKRMKQLVLLLAPQQYDESVKKGLEPHIAKAYRMHLVTNQFDDKDAIKVAFKKRKVVLATIDEKVPEAYTTIEELEV